MKQYRFVFLVIFASLAFLGFQITKARNLNQQFRQATQVVQNTVTVVVDNAATLKRLKNIEGSNVYMALIEASKKGGFEVKSKQYDFGVFVEEINGIKNTKEKSWIYFVNDVAGDVVADRKNLNPGDIVSWRYVIPTRE